MILDPVNSITSVNFYRRIPGQSLKRSALYLCYMAALFSIAGTVALKVKLGPVIEETFVWLENSMPPLTFSKGQVTSPLKQPLTLRHPQVAEVGLIIDTMRTEPVSAQQMEDQKIIAYLTANSLYLLKSRGRAEVYDFSKSAAKTITIDADFYRKADKGLGKILYPAALIAIFLAFLVWKTAASLVYSLLAVTTAALLDAKLAYKNLFTLSLYAQTLVIALQTIFLFMPMGIPYFRLVAFIITGIYIVLAVKANMPPETA